MTEDSIRLLVDAFYARVRCHPTLGPVFNAAVSQDAWHGHFEKMYAFWSSVMLTSGRYKGDPVSTHRRVAGIQPPLFRDWLELFEATANDLFAPSVAGKFACKARRIAESLKLALFFRPDRSWPEDLRHPPKSSQPCA